MNKIIIKNILAKKIKNSAGIDAIEVSVSTSYGVFSASAPEGTSKGRHEVQKYKGSIPSIINAIKKMKVPEINELSDILAFEEKTEKFGSNPSLSISFALLKALASEKKVPVWKLFNPEKKNLPKLLNKMLGGGKHGDKNSPTIQEFLTLTRRSYSYAKSIKNNLKIYNSIKTDYKPQKTDLEGGWILNLPDEKIFSILKSESGFRKIGADFASSSFYSKRKKLYVYKNIKRTPEQQMSFLLSLKEKFGLWLFEDPFHEDDFQNFAKLTKKIGKNALIVGDDLLTTSPERLKKAIELGACNGCIVKPDQIGSLRQTIEFIELAKKNNIVPIISHRSGETNENILADLAVGLDIPIMKISISGDERISKINRLLEISKE